MMVMINGEKSVISKYVAQEVAAYNRELGKLLAKSHNVVTVIQKLPDYRGYRVMVGDRKFAVPYLLPMSFIGKK